MITSPDRAGDGAWQQVLLLLDGPQVSTCCRLEQDITELETKTSTAHNAGMGAGGHIRVAVYTPEVNDVLNLAHFHRMEGCVSKIK